MGEVALEWIVAFECALKVTLDQSAIFNTRTTHTTPNSYLLHSSKRHWLLYMISF